MISADSFLREASRHGFDFYTGVPCSFLTPIINRVISDRATRYIGAASEGEAVAIAAGVWLAGRKTVVMCQNSGLGNTINPLTSLNWPFRIPTLLVVTWRGQPGLNDEPQHELMGRVMGPLLDAAQVHHRAFPKSEPEVASALDAADQAMAETGLPYALVMEKGAVAKEALDQPAFSTPSRGQASDRGTGGEPPSRISALESLLAILPDSAAVIATTGKCGRELFALADREQHLYQVGSMGCASAMGLGVALNVTRPVVVLDGDGAALMKLGNLATIGAYAPKNLVHVLLDNRVHDSTGGQATVSPFVDFPRVAVACGYRSGTVCDELDGFAGALKEALGRTGPHLIHLRIRPGSIENLGRPTVKPAEVARRFRNFLTRR
jgi:phosphonopyruvate decarboxylase